MRLRQGLLLLVSALLAACLGLAASVALYGPGPLLSSQLGRGLLQAWIDAQTAPGQRIARLGQPVPPMELLDLQGRNHRLPRARRPQLINYWASWCTPCRQEMPLLAGFARSQHADGVAVVGIALDTRENAFAFLSTTPVPFTILVETPGPHDTSVRLGNQQGVLPFTVLIGADGRLLKRRFGPFHSAEQLRIWAEPTK